MDECDTKKKERFVIKSSNKLVKLLIIIVKPLLTQTVLHL